MRLILISLLVVAGVAFVSGTFVLTDTLANVFDGLFTDVNRGVEVALDEVTARKAHVSSTAVQACADHGECARAQVQVVFLETPPQIFNVVALIQFGTFGNLAGATLALFDTPTAQQVLNRAGRFESIRIAADSGVSATDLRDRVRETLQRAWATA